jgi:RNA polymerase sigma-70 factor, ECF subfamily
MTQKEFNTTLLELKPDLMQYARHLIRDNYLAEDLVQDTYVKAFTAKDNIRHYDNLKGWVITIMYHDFVNQHFDRKKEDGVIDKYCDVFLLDYARDKGSISPESTYAVKEIDSIISGLKDDYRLPFLLHLEGYRYDEITVKLQINLTTVKRRIFKARKLLTKILKDYYN